MMLGACALLVRPPRVRKILGATAIVLLLSVLLVRLTAAGSGAMHLVTLPGGTSSRWAARLVDEQDVSLLGARLLKVLWHLQGAERDGLVAAMHDSYVEMRREQTITPSPVVDTSLLRQSAEAFDTLVIEPPEQPRAGVVFLHGFAGSFTLECWLIAKAAREIGAVTVCPAVGFTGHWWEPQGVETLRETIAYLHARGVRKLYLAGLSNGAFAAEELVPRFASEFRGLILISGSPRRGGNGGLPTLVVQGEHDANALPGKEFAELVHGTYAGFDGGHFVMVMKRKEVLPTIARWLRTH
jgi:pimeloyl-ACP methyl ester carboxylesterase